MKRAGKRKGVKSPAPKRSRVSDPFFEEDVGSHAREDEEDGVGFDAVDSEEENQEPSLEGEPAENQKETAEEKRLRLAKEYLKRLEDEEEKEGDEEDATQQKEAITTKLSKDALALRGKLFRSMADQLAGKTIGPEKIIKMKGHQLSVTCLALSSDSKTVFSASKDCTIIKWDVVTGKKLYQFPGSRKKEKKETNGHIGQVLALAISSDGKFLASAGKDHLIKIWNPTSHSLMEAFQGHRAPITCLAFRQGTNQLFSGSEDRTIKIWNVEDFAYVDTLYGHQSEVICLDSLSKERALSGGRDASVRIWKVVEETQLLFKATSSIDCVCFITEDLFFSGSEDGSIAIWNLMKKRAIFSIKAAHGAGNWITSVAALRHSDLVASGSCDGFIRLWKVSSSSIQPVIAIPMVGFVNSLVFAKSGQCLIAGIGQEHRLGRWSRIKEAKNGIRIIPLSLVI